MRILKSIFVLILLAAAFLGGYLYKGRTGSAPPAGGRKILYYVDPMHPAYKSDKPGIAPDCGMKLEPVYADGGPAEAAAKPKGKILYYRDPHQPEYKSGKPGLNPETGNDLEPVYENDPSNFAPGTIQISARKQQLIGVKYGVAERSGGARTIRSVGKVAYDETRISHVHTKFEGWVDKVFVDFTGKLVEKGQPLMTIYSPELLASQQELLLAGKARQLMEHSALAGAIEHSDSLYEAARRRLELFDLTDAQIKQVLLTGKPVKNITVYAPVTGYVLERKAYPQVKVMPEMDLYTLADLSQVWIMADVFESEIANIHVGQPARVTLSYTPGKALSARVSYIQPQVDPMTRTLKVRLEVSNPGMALKPDTFVNVEFAVERPVQVTVPVEAVLDTGDRKTVFVDRGNGYFEPRRVETGEEGGGRIAILSGLKPGERVVTSGNFLIDSESQLKAAASGMSAGGEHKHD
ncbi:MAG: efflux RND transporter periplasmic adaptor subunit [Bryobacteraceae bacterium]